jgi:hypothetical protein
MKIYFLVLILILTTCCCSNIDDRNVSVELFQNSYSKLPLIGLPLSIKSFGDSRFSTMTEEIMDTTLNKIFAHNWGHVIGRLPEKNNHFIVLSYFPTDIGTPLVSTYSKSGVLLDSLWLFNERPAVTVGLLSKQYVTITRDCLIQFTDSSSYLDTLDNIVNTEVIKKIFYFMNNGRIGSR